MAEPAISRSKYRHCSEIVNSRLHKYRLPNYSTKRQSSVGSIAENCGIETDLHETMRNGWEGKNKATYYLKETFQ